MSLVGQTNSAQVIEYNDATSALHSKRCAERAERRMVQFVAVPPRIPPKAASDIFSLNHKGLGISTGEAFVTDKGALKSVSGIRFQAHLRNQVKARSWYFMKRQSARSGKWTRVRRTRPNAVQRLTVNLSPWQMLFLQGLGGADSIRLKVLSLLQPVAEGFQKTTGRDLIAATIHWDSSAVHVNLYHSRVSESNELVGPGRVPTLGPWSVGEDRIQRLNVGEPDKRLQQNFARFAARHGDEAVPIDLLLHRILDAAFEAALTSEQLRVFAECQNQYREWKLNQRKELQKFHEPEQYALSVLKQVAYFFPPWAAELVRSATSLLTLLRSLLDGGGGSGGGAPDRSGIEETRSSRDSGRSLL